MRYQADNGKLDRVVFSARERCADGANENESALYWYGVELDWTDVVDYHEPNGTHSIGVRVSRTFTVLHVELSESPLETTARWHEARKGVNKPMGRLVWHDDGVSRGRRWELGRPWKRE